MTNNIYVFAMDLSLGLLKKKRNARSGERGCACYHHVVFSFFVFFLYITVPYYKNKKPVTYNHNRKQQLFVTGRLL